MSSNQTPQTPRSKAGPGVTLEVLQATAFVALIGLTGLAAASLQEKSKPDSQTPPPAVKTTHLIKKPAPVERPRIEVAFVLDTTGSMSGLLEGAKQKIWSIANRMASGQPRPEVRVGLIGYRDRGDAYVTERHDLSDDIDGIYSKLMALRADGGGDAPESVNQALHEAITTMSWSESQNVYRVVFLVGDAPPHMDYQGEVQYPATVKLAQAKGILVNTIQCGQLGGTREVWQAIAQTGNGEFVAIAQDGAMVAMASPMDEELGELNKKLASTMLEWGGEKDKAELRGKRSLSMVAGAGVAASRLSYLAKNEAGHTNSGRADLIDALGSGEVALDSVKGDALPAAMQAMKPAERKKFIEARSGERTRLKKRITTLVEKRDAWVKAEKSKAAAEGRADGFDYEVLDAIRAQAADVGIAYE